MMLLTLVNGKQTLHLDQHAIESYVRREKSEFYDGGTYIRTKSGESWLVVESVETLTEMVLGNK